MSSLDVAQKSQFFRRWWLFLGGVALVCSGCSGKNGGFDPNGMPVPSFEPPLAAGCNPLGGLKEEDCFTPFPSSYYTTSDARGVSRIDIPAAVLPASLKGTALDPAPLNGRDGYSPATPILAYFPSLSMKDRIDGSNLPGVAEPAASLAPSGTVQLLAFDTGERVPISAELDRNASDGERQGIVIYPLLRLRPRTRYVVAISGLRTVSGAAVPALSGFASLRDGRLDPRGPRLRLLPRYEELFARLEKQGVPRKSLQLAWDFTTWSDEPVYGRLLRMRDRAFAYPPPMGSVPVKIQTVKERPDPHLYRQIAGVFIAPSFLKDDLNGRLSLGPDGEPELRGLGAFPLIIHIPACVEMAPGPVPVMIYGHGLFGSAQSEMDSSYQREIIDRLCMVQIGTDWLGLSRLDRDYVIANVLGDFNNLAQLTDRLQQAHVNFAYLSHLIAIGAFDELSELHVRGQKSYDKARIYYYGISNGGIQGATALALSPHISRGALNVPGGFWSRMMWRSANFADLAKFLAAAYPDPFDRQLLVAASQALWDYSDPATYAPHLLRDPLPGSAGTKRVLYQEGIGDAQVPNLATRALARTMGLPLLNRPSEAVFGIGQVQGPVESAYVQFDIKVAPRPDDSNVPPAENPVHEAIRRLEAAKLQLQKFLIEDGRVIDSCFGTPCTFPPP
jgi:hypothetical protein